MSRGRWMEFGVAGLVVMAAWVWFFFNPGLVTPPEVIHLRECKQTLKSLGLALHNYNEVYGSFPPAIIRDEKDRPHLSWRTVLLPFLQQRELYEKYKLDEPWDSPHNKALVPRGLEIFHCPADKNSRHLPTTNYVAVIGPNTAWRADGTVVSEEDITDGLGNTILLVETTASGIHIFEPRDLSFDQMALTINPQVGQGVSSDHRLNNRSLGVHFLMADGTVKLAREELPAEVLKALLTINGGETVVDDVVGWRLAP